MQRDTTSDANRLMTDGGQPTKHDEWTLLEVEWDCITRRAKARFMEEWDTREDWTNFEARYHVYKAQDQLSVASYHSRQDESDELVKTNIADAVNHMLMAMATLDIDHDECQPIQSEDETRTVITDGGLEQTAVVDEFVVDHAVCREDAETFVHLGLDYDFHPTGGFWFPSDIDPDDDRSGWVHCEDAVPYGNLIQYPRDDRPPRMVGHEELPDWVKDRVVEVATDGGTEQVRAVFTAYEDEADLETNDAGTITNHEELVNDGQTYREIRFLSPDTVDAFDLTTVDESHTHWCDEVAAMEPGDRLRVDELRGNDDAE